MYDALNRLTSLTNFEQFEPDPLSPSGNTLSKFEYELYADGMRNEATEKILPQGGTPGTTPLKDQVVTYSYDNLNRLTAEAADDLGTPNSGYTAEYEYDLVGNRFSRAVWFEHNPIDELYTEYEYNERDQLIRELHKDTIPVAMIERPEGPYYAYVTDNGVFYTKAGSKDRIGQVKAFFIGLPSELDNHVLIAVLVLLPVAFLLPWILQALARLLRSPPRRISSWRRLLQRCISVFLAYVMLITPCGLENLSRASTQYSQLGVSTWGQADRIIEYGEWDGATGRTGNFTLGYDANGSVTKKITWYNNNTLSDPADDTIEEEVTYEYNLQNRLNKVTTDDQSGTVHVVEYTYNDEGIRVKAYSYDMPQGGGAKSNEKTIIYLVDPYNHTGYAQTLEELTYNYADPDPLTETPDSRKTYTIGDDMLTQAIGSGTGEHLLYDGHGSTRQLVTGSTSIVDDFSYDGYGVLLQDESVASANPGKTPTQDTSLLYAGEQFDTDLQMYYNRARYYDQNTGRFNRMDTYPGSPQDPQSLHKYLYVHCNPINGIDPGGQFSLLGMMQVAFISGLISANIASWSVALKGGAVEQIVNAQWEWFWKGVAIGVVAYGGAWAIHSLWVMVFGGGSAGIITADQAARNGFERHDDLVAAWRAQGASDPIHHIVQQTIANINNFGANAINSLRNSIPLAKNLHTEIHRFTQSSTTTLEISNLTGGHYSNLWRYLQTLPWEAQYRWGVAMMNYVVENETMQGFNPASQGLL